MLTKAAEDVLAERRRQVEGEDWSAEHDDKYWCGELSRAAACYAAHASALARLRGDVGEAAYRTADPPRSVGWPWLRHWWRPTTPRRDLVKSGALILAEIERLDRAEAKDRPDA